MTKYYEENTQKFIDETFGNDVSFLYAMFEKHLKENVKILFRLGLFNEFFH